MKAAVPLLAFATFFATAALAQDKPNVEAVNTDGVQPMAGGGSEKLRMREDRVTDGGIAEKVLANAPDRAGEFFAVPKVVE